MQKHFTLACKVLLYIQ